MSPDEGITDGERLALSDLISDTFPGSCSLKDCDLVADAILAAGFRCPTASVEAGPSRGAVAPLAPEDQNAAWTKLIEAGRAMRDAWYSAQAIESQKHDFPGEVEALDNAASDVDDALHALYGKPFPPPQADAKANLARAAHSLAPEGLRADPGIDESLLHDIAGDPRFAATVSEYLSNRCTIGVLITATLRTAARVGYVPGHLASTQAQARTPSAAGAASAPEGLDERQWMFQWLVPYKGWGRVTFCAMPLDRAEELWRRSHPDQHDYEVWVPLKIVRGLTAPPQAEAKAIPSPAPQAPPPEGHAAIRKAVGDAIGDEMQRVGFVVDRANLACRAILDRLADAALTTWDAMQPPPAPEAIVCPGCDGLGCEPDECDGRTVERACRTCNGTGKVAAPPVVGDMEGPAG